MSRRKKKSNLPLIMTISGGLLLIIAAWLLTPRPVQPTPTPKPLQSSTSHDEETFPEILRVNLEESKAAYDANSAVFLDVRDSESYSASHVPNALNIPLAELEARLDELDKGQWIISYCT